MRKKNMEKWKLEESVMKGFLPLYNEKMGALFVVKIHADKPDFLIEDAKRKLEKGVEVAHLYYGSREAKMLLGRSKRKRHGMQISTQTIDRLNKLLSKKKNDVEDYPYSGDTILVVRVASPIFRSDTFEIYRGDIQIPNSKFSEIWLLTRSPESTGAWDIIQRIF